MVGLLVIGLENGMFSLIMLVLVLISVCMIGMVVFSEGLFVVMKGISVLCCCLCRCWK